MLRNITTRLRLASALVVFVVGPALAETASMADAFVNSIGINVHISTSGGKNDGGNYQTLYSTWGPMLQASGIRNVRDGYWFASDAAAATSLIGTILANTGTHVKFLLSQGASCVSASVDSPTQYPGWGFTADEINGFEQMNELGGTNGFCGACGTPAGVGTPACGSGTSPTWYAEELADAQFLSSTVPTISTTGYSPLPIIGPSQNEYGYTLSQVTADSNLIGSLTSYITYGNIHDYCTHQQPSCDFGVVPAGISPEIGSLGYWVTETGYNNAGDTTQAQQNSYYSRMFFEWWNHGALKTFAYELVDDTITGDKFGILNSDASAKPSYTTLSNIIAILTDPGAPFMPGSLNFSFTNAPSTLQHTLLQKRNGVYYLALWMEQNYFDTFTPTAITVSFPDQRNVTQYDPLTSVTPIATWNSVSSVVLTVTDQTTILAISPIVHYGSVNPESVKLQMAQRF